MKELPIDGFKIKPDQRDDILRLSALEYTPEEIVALIGLDTYEAELFIQDANVYGTSVNITIKEGRLITRATPETKLHELAETGNVDAFKELDKVHRRHEFEKMINDIDNDEF